ncbi:MAG: restriction endonuclease subunit S [Ktedonobacteraceae bacterium]|nr:restriction endonuclease subunit S [Ktedonobacteraceae bacterium]
MVVRRSEWKLVPIEEVYSGLYDGPHATPEPASEGPIFLGIKNITEDGKLDLSEIRHIAEEDFSNWTKRVLPLPGDIVFTYEATLNRYAMIPEGFRGCLGRRLALIRPNFKRIDTKFLFYYFFGEEWRETIANNIMSGSTVDRIPIISFPKFKVRVPPLPIQRTIASILSAYDDLIENNTRRIAILEEMAQMIYEEWFVKFRFPGHERVKMVESEMGMIPERWQVTTVENIATICRGKSYASENLVQTEEGLPFINLKCIVRDGGFREDGLKRYKGAYKETQTAKTGDIVMAVTDMTQERRIVARAARVPKNNTLTFVFSMDLVKIVPKEEQYRYYLYSMFRFSKFPDEVKQYANGANVLHLSPERIGEFAFPLPPVSLCIRFSEICAVIYEQCDLIRSRCSLLSITRDLLLPKLISGEIDVSSWSEDSAEEAAQELATSVIGSVGERQQHGGIARKVAEAGPIEPMEKDALEWHSLWEE